jgi:hypothetical protein
MTAVAEELVPANGNGEDEPASYVNVMLKLNAVLVQQTTLIQRVEANTNHVIKLQHLHDPLTWKKRAAILFAGTFAGTGAAALLMHVAFHVIVR